MVGVAVLVVEVVWDGADCGQGLTIVHCSAQRKRCLWVGGALCRGC